MNAELAKLDATLTKAEAQRTIDYSAISNSLRDVQATLPTKGTIWRIVLTGFGGVIAAGGLAWSIFGAGASITGAFADRVFQQKAQGDVIETKLDKLLAEKDEANGKPDTKSISGPQRQKP